MERGATAYQDRWWTAADGVWLHARDYPGPEDRPPLVCLPGLTRNARDFERLADRLAGAWRVIAVDFRGRGESKPAKDPASYVPDTYVGDVEEMLAALGIARFVAVGTSLGGLVTMMLAERGPERIAGAVLNDVGPQVEPAGLQRIRGYVGRASSFPTWMHAARALAEAHRDVHPGFGVEDWLAMAKRTYRLTATGKIILDYDLKIAEPFRTPGGAAPPDLWPALEALKDTPVLILRGERSDVLSPATAARMVDALSRAELVTVRATGHAPTLDEPDAMAGLDRLLARVAQA
jgi:pimeloyl-ACP methyl ester carboxylesterase